MRTVALLLLGVLLGGVPAAPAPPAAPPVAWGAEQRVDLAHIAWTRDGEAPEQRPRVVEAGLTPPGVAPMPGVLPAAPYVVLPLDGRGVRWGVVFHTDAAAMMRMELEWRPGPTGALFELSVNGQRLRPARDGWRPSDRAVRTDLGALWLGRGEHLLEFVCREAVDSAELRLCALRLVPQGDD